MTDLRRSLAGFLDKGSFSLKGHVRKTGTIPTVYVSSQVGTDLLSELGAPVIQLRRTVATDSTFKPVELKRVTISLNLKTHHEVKTSENVVGLLEGSDPELKQEYIVLTAHYDHVGVNPATGDIYNGADDDGSGTSMILELAEAFVSNPKKPKRSMLFMTVAGEEKGLLGSAYYTANPLVPLNKTIANINMDMIGRIDKKHRESASPYVYVIGSDKISTELDSIVQAANRQTVNLALDYEYNDDNDPNQFYRRSDHYNFARNGIPIVFFFTGVHEDYHQPTDTVEKIEFNRMVLIGRLMYTTTWKVAHLPRMLRKDGKPSVYSGRQ
ncbi:MAG: M28 family peptidase [Ignavibacteriales bacterium]|nr:M28 family peptidase [Ignavibacteriales bacterium]